MGELPKGRRGNKTIIMIIIIVIIVITIILFLFHCVLIYHPLHMYLFFNHNSLTYIELDASTHKKYSNIGSLLVLVGRAQFLETHLKEKEILKLGRAN